MDLFCKTHIPFRNKAELEAREKELEQRARIAKLGPGLQAELVRIKEHLALKGDVDKK